jgi:hypothetical protein
LIRLHIRDSGRLSAAELAMILTGALRENMQRGAKIEKNCINRANFSAFMKTRLPVLDY